MTIVRAVAGGAPTKATSWGPSRGPPSGMGCVQCVDTTAAYVAKLEKINRDQTARILQLEEELRGVRTRNSENTQHLRTVEAIVPKLKDELKEKERMYNASLATYDEDKVRMEHMNAQLRRDMTALETEVLSAIHNGQINYTSVWKPTLMDITHLRHELEMLTSKHAHVCGDNAKLRHDLKQTRSDMLAALDRIHKLATLNEPHQTFVANMMRERNYWQERAKTATRELDQTRNRDAQYWDVSGPAAGTESSWVADHQNAVDREVSNTPIPVSTKSILSPTKPPLTHMKQGPSSRPLYRRVFAHGPLSEPNLLFQPPLP